VKGIENIMKVFEAGFHLSATEVQGISVGFVVQVIHDNLYGDT
jgi:hypothetical protein